MLVDDQYRKCVAFLFSDVLTTGAVAVRRPMGTAFLVAMPLDGDAGVVYAVTARHVIDGTRKYGNLTIRFNSDDGTFTDYHAPHDDWTLSPTTDVAVAPLKVAENHDVIWLGPDLFLTAEVAAEIELGEGDNVFFVGLFSSHFGEKRSLPVVRFGNIALMPHEPLKVKIDPTPNALPKPIDAYLVEARSWGGQSGSPAFAYFPTTRRMDTNFTFGPIPLLLGIVQGHYNISQPVRLIGAPGEAHVDANAGMAIVIPAQDILDTLNTKELVDERERLLREHHERNQDGVAVPDLVTPEEPDDRQGDVFIRDLRKASE